MKTRGSLLARLTWWFAASLLALYGISATLVYLYSSAQERQYAVLTLKTEAEAVAAYSAHAAERGVTIQTEADPGIEISGDAALLRLVVFNLLDNAIKYSKEQPVIEIETQIANNMLAIKVKDNGIGMNKETQARVFEKFYRAHTGNLHNVKGFGLGLSYVKAMAEAHGGKARVDSAPGKGSTFTVTFPLA